jgi:hypothetical protein
MTPEQKEALDRVKTSIAGKPPPSSIVDPRTGKRSITVPHTENIAGDVLDVLAMVKEHDEKTKDLLDGCQAVADEYGRNQPVIHQAHDLKHLIGKVEGA